jgi:hypothetical protein
MARLETEILSELIGAKREILGQLRDLGVRQREVIDSGDTDHLFRVLAAKQRLLADLQQVEQRLTPYREQDPDQRAWRSQQDRDHCAAKSEQCAHLLAEVIRQERESERAMVRRRDDTAMQLRAVHSAMHLQQSYESCQAATSGGLDLTCGE